MDIPSRLLYIQTVYRQEVFGTSILPLLTIYVWDMLCSDYIPTSPLLLLGPFLLTTWCIH